MVFSIFWLQYSNQMHKTHQRIAPSPSKSQNKIKNHLNNDSTRLQALTTSFSPHRLPPTQVLPSKFHACCSPLSTAHHFSFKPEVSCLPLEIYPQQSALSRSRQEHWEQLTQDRREKQMQRTGLKVQEQQDKLRECTFAPVITPFGVNPSGSAIYSKLYEQAQARKRCQQQLQRQKMQKQREQLQKLKKREPDSSKWSILNKQKFDLEPLYKRLQKVIQEKRKNRKMVAERQQKAFPFFPQVNQNSKKIAQGRKGMVQSVVDRLIQDFAKREGRINILREGREAHLKKQCPFAPTINNYLPTETAKPAKGPKQQNIPLFSPTINPLSALMTQERANQTQDERYFRMIQTPAIKKADKMSIIQAEVYAQCCFNPEINNISRQLHGCGQKHHACQVKKQEIPTHRPSINHASRVMSQSKRAKSLQNIKQKNKMKEEQYKQQMEYSKMSQCTFKPKIVQNKDARASSKGAKLQEVSGFQKFYENRQKYNEKERARKALQEKLFRLQLSYDARVKKSRQEKENKKE